MENKTPVRSWTKKDFKLDWFSGSGAGGQHRNKHQNCCRITHIESGIMAVGQNHRDRTHNLREAFKTLAERIVAHYAAKDTKERAPSEERIRTYHEADNRVKDHLSGHQDTWDHGMTDEGFAAMIEARRHAMIEQRRRDL